LSARYSTSPSLHLVIGNSNTYRCIHAVLCLLALASLYRLWQRGYPVSASLLVPAASVCCWRLAAQPWVGAALSWRAGQWLLQCQAMSRPITIHPRHTCAPWVIYLAWSDSIDGRHRSVFLFPDSAPRSQLRHLRVRLALER